MPRIAAGGSRRKLRSPRRAGARGAVYTATFDHAPADCAISADELAQSDLLKTLLAPDVMIDRVACLSFGVGVTAVRAGF